MNERVYTRGAPSGSGAPTRPSSNKLQSHDSSTSIASNKTASSSSTGTSSSNLSTLSSLSDVEEAEAHQPVINSAQRPLPTALQYSSSSNASGNRSGIGIGSSSNSSAHQADGGQQSRNPYAGLSTMSLGLRGFSNSILSPAQRLAKDSLPSPPATTQGGESERGSIGSANSQNTTAKKVSSTSTTRPSLRLDDTHPAYDNADAQTTIRGSPADLSSSRSSTSSTSRRIPASLETARPEASLRYEHNTPSPVNRYSVEAGTKAESSSSSLARSRSRSPLVETSSRQSSSKGSPEIDSPSQKNLNLPNARSSTSPTSRNAPSLRGNVSPTHQLSRSSSFASHHSSRTPQQPTLSDKGKGREDVLALPAKTPSMNSNKIRKASEIARQRIYSVSDAGEENLYDQPQLPTATSSTALSRDTSRNSTSSAKSHRTTDSSSQSKTATRYSSSPDDLQSRYPSKETGSEAFARNNRNSIISLSQAKISIEPPVASSSRSSSEVDYELASLASQAERSLEEGEILEELPPPDVGGFNRVSASRNYRYGSERKASVSSRLSHQSSSSSHSSHHRRRDPDFTGRPDQSSPPRSTLLLPSDRSYTPSPSIHNHIQQSAHAEALPSGSGSRYTSQRTPYRNGTNAIETYDVPPRGAARLSSETTRTPRYTPHHGRGQSEAASTSRSSTSAALSRLSLVDPPDEDASQGGANERRAVVPRRSYSALSQYSNRQTDKVDDRTNASRRRAVHSNEVTAEQLDRVQRSFTEDHRPLNRSASTAFSQRNAPQKSDPADARQNSTRKYTTGGQYSRTGSDSRASHDDLLERRVDRLDGEGRTTPRNQTRPSSRLYNTAESISSSRSVRNIEEQRYENHRTQNLQPRFRTRSIQGDRDLHVARPASRTDVFVDHGHTTRENFRTLPSSASRARLGLRDLEVGSSDWWQEVSHIRQEATQPERPASRSSRHVLDSFTSPESRPSTASSARKGNHGTMSSTRSSNSLPSAANSSASRRTLVTDSPRSQTSRHDRYHVPTMPSPRTASRNGASVQAGRSGSAGANASSAHDDVSTSRHHMLQEAYHTFAEVLHRSNSAVTSSETNLDHAALLLIENAIMLDMQTSALSKEVVNTRVEAELASDNEDGGSAMHHHRHLSSFARLERPSNQLHRLASEQVRLLTELFITWARQNRTLREDSSSHADRSEPSHHASAAIIRSATLPTSTSRRSLHSPADEHSTGPPRSVRRPKYVNTLERIASGLSETRLDERERDERTERPGTVHPSPRSLRRAKSSSTSHISQNTVKGYIASSPIRSSEEYFEVRRSETFSNRSGSVVSANSRTSSSPIHSLVNGSPHEANLSGTASGRLETQLASEPAAQQGEEASRWRPFAQKRLPRQSRDESDLPDSPSMGGTGPSKSNRSSELARTLSRMSSKVLR